MTQEIELQIMPSGNVAVYRGNGFIPTEKLTEEEKEFIIDRVSDELGVNTKGDRETFAEHYGCIPEYEKLESPKTTEKGIKELQQEESVSRVSVDNVLWNSLQDVLALGFIHFLNENRQDGKMCLSNAECQDIMDAFLNKKWERIKRYSDKYLLGKKRLDMKQEDKQLGNECNEHELTADAIRAWNSGYEKGYALGYANGKNAYLEDEDGAVLDKTETETTKKDDTEECYSEEYREGYDLSESKKNEIVSGKFLYALTNFSLFKKWEAYWLEYVGEDTYIGRSDNILNEKVVITPYQLDNYFSETVPSGFEKRLTEWFYGMRTWGLTHWEDGETCENFCDSQAHKAVEDLWDCIEKTPTKSD